MKIDATKSMKIGNTDEIMRMLARGIAAVSKALEDFGNAIRRALEQIQKHGELPHMKFIRQWIVDGECIQRQEWWQSGGEPPEFKMDINEPQWWNGGKDDPPDFDCAA